MSLRALEKVDPKIIDNFRQTGKSEALPVELQNYIHELDKAVEIHNHTPNITRAARKLREQFPHLSHQTCRNRFYDAVNLFHLNSTVKDEAWLHYYADRFEDLATAALAGKNIREASINTKEAKIARLEASKNSINPDDFKPQIFVISPEVKAGRFGITEKNLKTMWPDTRGFINDLPIDEKFKKAALHDAAMVLGEDVDFDIIDDEEEDQE